MKKSILWMLTAILCCGLTMAFTACGSDDDNAAPPTTYTYSATNSSITVTGSDVTLGFTLLKDYNEAIIAAIGTENKVENDQAVIAACDKVYADHCERYAGKISGKITITKEVVKSGQLTSSDLKVYTYTK